MKRGKLMPRAVPPAALPEPDDLIARAAFVALIHQRLARFPKEPRNRISQYVTEATAPGPRQKFEFVTPGVLRFGDGANWARLKWGPVFSDFPLMENVGSATLTVPLASVSGSGTALPRTLRKCRRALARAYGQIARLNEEVAHLRDQLARSGKASVDAS